MLLKQKLLLNLEEKNYKQIVRFRKYQTNIMLKLRRILKKSRIQCLKNKNFIFDAWPSLCSRQTITTSQDILCLINTTTHRNKTVNVDKIKHLLYWYFQQFQCLNIKKHAVHNTHRFAWFDISEIPLVSLIKNLKKQV